jgi:hypothetical protein
MPASIPRSAAVAASHHSVTTVETTPRACAVAALTAGACTFCAGGCSDTIRSTSEGDGR